MAQSKAVGQYEFGFFVINLNCNFDFENVSNNDKNAWRVLFHEYIHFLQEVSTTFGVFNLHCILLELLIAIYKSEGTYDAISEETKVQWEQELGLCNCVIGDIDEKSYEEYKYIIINNIEIKNDDIMEECLNFKGIELANISVTKYHRDKNTSSEQDDIIFGSRIIMESMASLIERKVYLDKESAQYIQYNLAELVCQKIYPEVLKDNKDYIIALCETALMYVNSGVVFVRLLEWMKEEQFKPNSALEIYEYACKNIGSYDCPEIDCTEEYNKYYKECCIDISTLLEHDFFTDLRNTIFLTMDKGKEYGQQVISILSQLQDENVVELFLKIQELLPPINMVDKNGWTYTGVKKEQVKEKADVLDILFLSGLYKILLNGKKECIMYPICKGDNVNRIREHCLHLPIDKKDIKNGCRLSDICHCLGLKELFLDEE